MFWGKVILFWKCKENVDIIKFDLAFLVSDFYCCVIFCIVCTWTVWYVWKLLNSTEDLTN